MSINIKKTRFSIIQTLLFLSLSIFAVICIYPMIWLFLNSFKDNTLIYENPWGLPTSWSLDNYIRAIKVGRIGRNYFNSIFITVTATFFAVSLSSMASYGIVRMKWKLSEFTLLAFVIGVSIPSYAVLVPLFKIFNNLRIINTYFCIILVHIVFSFPISIFLLSGFFKTVPRELEEAAIIDGTGILGAFRRIVLPISLPSIVTVSVIDFITIWNDLLLSQVFLSDLKKMPLPVGLTLFSDSYSTDNVGLIAAVVLTVIPTIGVYIFLHDKIISGMTAGAVKG